MVKRDVVRLVTPGTLTEESLLEARRHNYLAALAGVRDGWALAWCDISTGVFHVMPLAQARIGAELARLAPREVLVSEAVEETLREVLEDLGVQPTMLGRATFDSTGAEQRLCELFGVAIARCLRAFSSGSSSRRWARWSITSTSRRRASCRCCNRPGRRQVSRFMQIDAATRRNLELTHSLNGGRAGSLLSVIDRTVTAGGARLLERRLSSPSRELSVVIARQGAVAWCLDKTGCWRCSCAMR